MTLFHLDNLLHNDGIGLIFSGMLIVFAGLTLISLFLYLLPHALTLFDRLRSVNATPSATATAVPPKAGQAPLTAAELQAAISLVVHLELERCGGELQRITLNRRGPGASFWNARGRMRSLSDRSPHA
ncbi:MAG: OadG family protein [Desulfuromonas thiophila]|jgi:Na+-transporting methylmalonyl-CoA/oxaloacetate decarboxylase gamma subunit|nr:OadG family protein [Desulfuromonas thiophila]MDD3802093.1 OadG family protein [Desulfuromonas thiophila]